MNTGREASKAAERPALAPPAHVSWPLTTPSAVSTPPRRPAVSVFRIVRAVSWPGVTITTSDTPRNAARCPRLTTPPSCSESCGLLLDRDGLRQVTRLIDVQVAQSGDPVRKELQRQHREHRLQEGGRARHVDDVVRVVLDVLGAVGRD